MLYSGRGLTRQPSSTVERTPSVDRRDGLCPVYGTHKLGGLPKTPKNPQKGGPKNPQKGVDFYHKNGFSEIHFSTFFGKAENPHGNPKESAKKRSHVHLSTRPKSHPRRLILGGVESGDAHFA